MALIPVYALITAFLFVVIVELVANVATPTAPQDPAPAPAPAKSPAPFKAADEGKPTFRVIVTGSPAPELFWSVLKQDKSAGTYHMVADPLPVLIGHPQQLDKPLVDRLLCVRVDTLGWSIAPSEGVVDLTPENLAGSTVACQGGWSDPRAVPNELRFTARKGR